MIMPNPASDQIVVRLPDRIHDTMVIIQHIFVIVIDTQGMTTLRSVMAGFAYNYGLSTGGQSEYPHH